MTSAGSTGPEGSLSPILWGVLALASGTTACRSADAARPDGGEASARASRSASSIPTPEPTATGGGGKAAGAETAAEPPAREDPFGLGAPIARYTCGALLRGGPFRSYLAAADTQTAFVAGDDWLALVNRSPTGALAPGYAPGDLVDVHDNSARSAVECEGRECLRREAAAALHRMLGAMRDAGVEGRVQSAFRSFGTQCWVFASWAHQARGGFCEATEQSALPGHSQHQLGTTLDLFTKEWAAAGAKTGQGAFRSGFGCTPGGLWLADRSWQYGFVVSYPIHPDDRMPSAPCRTRDDRPAPIDPKTGYKHEPWHLRYVGVDAAARYHEAWRASGTATPDEITLEQWLRAERNLLGDGELPVCDGCQCGACATLAGDDARTPCGKASLTLDEHGLVVAPGQPPSIRDASVKAGPNAVWFVSVGVHAPAHTPTQTPIVRAAGPVYERGATFLALRPDAGTAPHKYPDLPGAYRVWIEPDPAGPLRWPWRASLASSELAVTWNRANLVLPAKAGDSTVEVGVVVPEGTRALRIALSKDGAPREVRVVDLPR